MPRFDIGEIAKDVLTLAEQVAPLLGTAGVPVTIAIKAGKGLADLLENLEPHAEPGDQPAIRAQIQELRERVSAHADRTADSLRGGGGQG